MLKLNKLTKHFSSPHCYKHLDVLLSEIFYTFIVGKIPGFSYCRCCNYFKLPFQLKRYYFVDVHDLETKYDKICNNCIEVFDEGLMCGHL